MVSTSFVDSDGVDQLCEWIEKQQALLILINSRINILGDVTYGCQQNGSTVQNVDSMGMPKQQMVTFQTRETKNGATRYLNHMNKFADQQDGPTTHIVVSGPISRFLLPRKHKMGCANCILKAEVRGSIKKTVFFLGKTSKGGRGGCRIRNFLIRKKWDFFGFFFQKGGGGPTYSKRVLGKG